MSSIPPNLPLMQARMAELKMREQLQKRDLNPQGGSSSPRRVLTIVITIAAILLTVLGIVVLFGLIYH